MTEHSWDMRFIRSRSDNSGDLYHRYVCNNCGAQTYRNPGNQHVLHMVQIPNFSAVMCPDTCEGVSVLLVNLI